MKPPSSQVTIGALSVNCFLQYGIAFSSLALYLPLIRADLHWSSQAASSLLAAYMIASTLASPLCGWLIDRIGAKPIVIGGCLLSGGGLLLASWAPTTPTLVTAFFIAGLGLSASSFMPSVWIARHRFPARLAFVVGMILAAASVGSAVLPPLIGYALTVLSWRQTVGIGAVTLLLVCTGLSLWAIPPDGPDALAKKLPEEPASSLREILADLRKVQFIALVAVQFMYTAGFMAMYILFIPFLTDRGFSLSEAGLIYGIMNAVSALGLVGIGWIGDRVNMTYVLVFTLVATGLCVGLLQFVSRATSFMLPLSAFILVWGLLQAGPQQMTPLFVARMVEKRHFALFNGIVEFMRSLATALGPVVASAIYDSTKSYLTAFYIGAFGSLISAGFSSAFLRITLSKEPGSIRNRYRQPAADHALK